MLAYRSTRRRNACRSGFTLMEVVLVLALLVVLAAIVWPALDKPFATERLKRAADQVRAEWTRTRIDAMTSGVPHVFRYQPETGSFQVESWGGLEAETEAASAAAFGLPEPLPVPQSDDPLAAIGQALPEGIVFFSSQTSLDARSLSVVPLTDTTVGEWSQPIYFYPDGTATDARLLLRNEHDLYVQLELRGLTGVTRVTDVLSAEEILP